MNTPRVESSHTVPHQSAATLAAAPISPERDTDSCDQHRHRDAQNEHDQAFQGCSERGSTDEVLLHEVIGDRGLYFHTREQRIERRCNHFARAERGCADEHDLAAQRPDGDLVCQNIRRRDVRERSLLPSIAQ